jgi:hypothetical protein
MAKKSKSDKDKPRVNPQLQGFDIKIDRFGEIKTNYDIDKINEFLNKEVDDKKLRDRDDIEKGPNQDNDQEENQNQG